MNLELGDRLVWDGVAFELIACDATSARLRAVDEGYVRVALINELQRDPSIEWPQRELRQVRTFDPQSLKALPSPQQAKIQLWLPHVTRLDQFLSSARRDADETNRIIAEVVHAVGVQMPGGSVDPRTVWRKLQGYRDFGALGLIDKRYRTKTQRSRDPLLLEIVADVCRQADRQSTGTRGRTVDDILYAIADRYGEHPPFDIPSNRTLDRIVSEMPRAKHLTRSAKTRASLANRPQREFQQHESPRLGEHTQIDTTKFDAEITLENGSVTTRNGVERPEMTILLKIRSRTPMAAVLRAGGTKSVDLVTLLARALTPYERRPQGARETRELVSAAWADPYGISQEELDRYRSLVPVIFPENITVDHGKIFTSTAFTEACERLGISIIECNPYTPTGKPHVEANFGSVAEEFAQYLRSHVGRSVEHRGKGDTPHPPPTLLQAQELLDDWIAVHWMHRPHDGLRDPLRPSRALTPMETVTLLRQITPDLPIPFGREEYISLLPRQDRTIQDYGVNIGRRRYSSRRLRDVVAVTPKAAGRKWTIRRDPFNLYSVWLEYGEEFIPLLWKAGDAEMPFRDELHRQLRSSDGTQGVDSQRVSAALKEGIRRGRFGDPHAGRSDARARAAMSDPMALSSPHVEPPTDEDAADQAEAPGGRFRRTGGNGFLEIDDEGLWSASSGFSSQTEETRGRIDD
ncbi:putative transposase [Microbacterium testaceum]|uniref:Mu transposase C-terminal domain-containing protein n=1 Tax=Microbacterium testaceum TaxID=2033 RepID=UPI002788D327|nr:Mu transposase C-terminal domain-containing protein [Microbacterium testaceum]MDQ1175169.1 putative transposase [Microbacterium testaceum]